MKKIQILDCTIRDGGYYTNWDFNSDLIKTYFTSLNKLPIDWIEIGYRSKPQNEYLGQYFYCPDYVLEEARKSYNGKIAVMLNEKDVKKEDLIELIGSAVGNVDMIRLAIDPQNLLRAIDLATQIKKMGFLVGFNLMYMTKWQSISQFYDNLSEVNLVADYFYMVDSFGGIYPEDLIEIITKIKTILTIPIGFHGHNNLETALVNSITAINSGAEMVDCTITGMGRGAGNLKTELFLTALNAKNLFEIDFNALSDVTHEFEKLQEEYKWGTNLPYMVSGANSLPQKDVMDWVGKRFYSYNSIIRALNNQKNKVQDNSKYEAFKSEVSFGKALIIGGGKSIQEHIHAISEFVKSNPDIPLIHASAKNAEFFKGISNTQYFCLVGIEGNRLENILNEIIPFKGNCLLPAFPRKMGTYVPPSVEEITMELDTIEFSPILKDAHTSLALQAAIQLNASKLFIIGYDGYAQSSLSSRNHELFNENEYLFASFKVFTGFELESLTPTMYKNLKHNSIYSIIK
jgi:4-hydroxy 2-oxovalerate aldolase